MSTQYTDGSFSDIQPFPEAMKTFMDAVKSNTAKAFHVGTSQEIDLVKLEKSNAEGLKKLDNELAELKAKINIHQIIKIPTHKEVKAICGGRKDD